MLNGLGSLMLLRFIDLVKLRGALKYAKKVRSCSSPMERKWLKWLKETFILS
jgi:hypothetical protein